MKRAFGTIALLLAILLLGVSFYVQFLGLDYGDKQWEMYYARMLVNGKKLYTDIFPVSPPLIFWIYALPASLAHAHGEFPLLMLLGLIFITLSIFASTRLIASHPAFAERRTKQLEFALLLAFVLIFRTSPIYFLDREHLFLVLIFPYLMHALPSLVQTRTSRGLRILTGVLAGIGFCIKPYCLIVFVGIQLLYILLVKSPRILLQLENIIIYGVSAAYTLSIFVLTPEYISTVLPMALLTYSATADTTSVLDYSSNALSVLFLTFLMFRLRYTSPYRRDIFYLAGLCPFFLLYALANNNWAYTYYPLSSMALIVTGFVLWEFLYLRNDYRTRALPSWTFSLGAVLCIVTLLLRLALSLNYFSLMLAETCHHNVRCQADDQLVAEVKGDKGPLSFGTISIDFTRWTRLADYSGAAWDTRFPQLWMLPKFLVSPPEFMTAHLWVLDYVAQGLAHDMDTRKPSVMFVDDSDVFYTARMHVDLVAFFSADTSFKQAWSHYHFVHKLDLCNGRPKEKCSYDVYRRVD